MGPFCCWFLGLVAGLHQRARRAPGRFCGLLVLLALAGAGAAVGGVRLWADSHYRQARWEAEQHHGERAWAHIQHCLWVRPGSAPDHLLAARILRQLGRFSEARDQLDRAQELGGPLPAIRLERMMLMADGGEVGPLEAYALDYIREHAAGRALTPHVLAGHEDGPAILEALTHGFTEAFRFPEAQGCIAAWLAARPDDPEALMCRGLIAERQMRFEAAGSDYRHIVEAEPDHTQARLHLAKVLLTAGEAKEAQEHYEYLWQHGVRQAEVGVGLTQCRDILGHPAEADTLLDEVVAREPDSCEALLLRGQFALRRGDPATAETWLRRALAIDPSNRQTNQDLYQALEQEGKKEEARARRAVLDRLARDQLQLERILQLDLSRNPHDPALHFQVGAIYLRNGRRQEGLRWLASALREDPRHRPTLQLLADYYTTAGDLDTARHYRDLLRQAEADPVPDAPAAAVP